jgi:hypothetical protein
MIDVLLSACLLTYRVDSSVTDYTATIPRAQRIVTEATGYQFVEVAEGPADVTYVQDGRKWLPEYGPSVWGYWTGRASVGGSQTIILTTQQRGVMPWIRLPLTIHETLHAVGVSHVDDPSALMASVSNFNVEFTAADLEAIEGVKCGE